MSIYVRYLNVNVLFRDLVTNFNYLIYLQRSSKKLFVFQLEMSRMSSQETVAVDSLGQTNVYDVIDHNSLVDPVQSYKIKI